MLLKWSSSAYYIQSWFETEFLDGIKIHYFANVCMIYFPQTNLYLFLEK